MSRISRAAPCIVLICLLTGCSTVQSLMQGNKPSVSLSNVSLANLSLDGVDLVFDVKVSNPYDVPLPITDLGYSISSGGTAFLSGNAASSGTVPAMGSKVIRVPAGVKFTQLMNALSGVKPGSVVPYDAKLDLSVNAPAVGKITLPLSKSGSLPVPALPSVKVAGLKWTDLSMQNAAGEVSLKITSANDFPVDLSAMSYNLSLGGTKVAQSRVEQAVKFEKDKPAMLTFPVSFSPIQLGLGVFNLIQGKGAAYQIAGDMNLATPFGQLNLPYDSTGKTAMSK
ncbi:MAG: hypothetical protein GC164_07460 [Phycisphaera sp.]|nr:hypothetical protein [Phycisphaera sp.]